jgi:hypothetical protein
MFDRRLECVIHDGLCDQVERIEYRLKGRAQRNIPTRGKDLSANLRKSRLVPNK